MNFVKINTTFVFFSYEGYTLRMNLFDFTQEKISIYEQFEQIETILANKNAENASPYPFQVLSTINVNKLLIEQYNSILESYSKIEEISLKHLSVSVLYPTNYFHLCNRIKFLVTSPIPIPVPDCLIVIANIDSNSLLEDLKIIGLEIKKYENFEDFTFNFVNEHFNH